MPITFLDEEEEQIAPVTPTKRKITFLDEEEAGVAPVTPQAAQPAVTQPSPYKYDPTRFRPKGLVATKVEQEVGTLEGIASAARNAFDSSRQALDIVGDVTPEEAQNIAKIEFDKQSRKVAPGYDEYQKAEGFDAVLAFAKNPIEVTSNIVAEGLAGSLPALGAGLAAGGVGAAAGSVVPVVGTGVGFTAGQVAGTFAGSLATEYGSKILEEMQSEGVDLTKPESIQGFFENEDAVAKARDKAISRGIPVAAFDAISAGIGGKLGRVIGKQFLTKTGEAAAELGVQAGLGGGGEVAGALAAGEPIEGKAVFAEVIGEAGPGAAEIITGRMADRAARVKAEEEKKIKAAAQLSDNLEQNNAPLTAAAVKSTTATTIEQDKLAAQLEEQLDADEIASQVSGQLAVTKEPTAAPPETTAQIADRLRKQEEEVEAKSIRSDKIDRMVREDAILDELLGIDPESNESFSLTRSEKEQRLNPQQRAEYSNKMREFYAERLGQVAAPTITPEVTPAVPTAQPPTPDATQEIIQPEGVREEPQDRVEGQPPEEAGVGDSILGAARGEEEGQVVPPAPAIPEAITRAIEERRPISAPFALQYGVDLPSGWTYEDDFFVPPAAPAAEVVAPEPTISEIQPTSELVGEQPAQPTIREVPEISPIVGAEPAAIVEQEPVAPAEEAEFAELNDLMERRRQAQSKVKGVKFSKKDEVRYNELLPKYRSRFIETVAPESDPVVWKDIEGNDIKVSSKGTFYTVRDGRVRTGVAFQPKEFVTDVSPQPVSAAVVESNNVQLPEGYTKQGDLYVYQPTAPAPVTTPPVTEAVTPAPAAVPAGIAVGSRVKSGRDPKVYVVEEVLPQTEAEQREGDYSVMLRDEKSGKIEKYPFSIMGLKALGAKKPALPKKLARSGATSFDFTPRQALAPEQQVNRDTIIANVKAVYEGIPNDRIEIVNDPAAEGEYGYIAAYNPNTNKIEINQAYYTLEDDLDLKISHELGHYLYQDPRWKKAFARLYKNLKPSSRRKLDAFMEQVYSDYESGYLDEEAEINALEVFLKDAPDNRNLFQKFIDEILDFVTDALSVFSPYFKTLARDPRRIARNIALIASERFKSGEVIEGVDTTIESEELRLARAAELRKEQVGGEEREETRYITTPKGILSMNTDVLREKFFDGTSVSPEKTTQAWGYISRLLDIKSGNANEFAGEINDTVIAELEARRDAAIAAGEDVDPDENLEERIGAAMFSVELMNYAGKLAEQGDQRMLKFMIRNVNSMPVDKYAGGISDLAIGLRTRLEYDVSGFGAYSADQKGKVERTAAVMFGTNKPNEEQVKTVKDALDESEKTELGSPEEVAGDIENVEKRTGRSVVKKIEEKIKASTAPKKEELLISFQNLNQDRKFAGINITYKPQKIDPAKNIQNLIIGKLVDYRKTLVNQGADGLESTFWQTMSNKERKPGPLGEIDQAQNNELANIVQKTLIDLGMKGEPPNTKMTDIEKVASILNKQLLGEEKKIAADKRVVEEIERRRSTELEGASDADAVNAKYDAILNAWNEAMSRQTNMPISDNMLQRLINAELKEQGSNVTELINEPYEDVLSQKKKDIVDSIIRRVYGVSKEAETGIEISEDYDNLSRYLKQTLENMLKMQAEKRDAAVARTLQRGLGDLPALPEVQKNKTQTIVQQDLRQQPDMGRREPWQNMLVGKLTQAGVAPEQAENIANLVWRQHEINDANRKIKEMKTAAEKGSLAVIIDRIKNTSLEKQQSPEWKQEVIKEYLRDAGLSLQAAETAAKLYDSVISERLAAAKQKAFEDTLAKAAPWKNYASRNGKLAKDALKKIKEAIRAGVLDPEKNAESIIAALNGWTGFTKEQYQRIVQIDTILNDPEKDDITKREAMDELNRIISKAKLPVSAREAIGPYYVGQALGGIPTATVNVASPIGFSIRNLMVDISKYAATDPAKIPIAFESFLDSMRSWYNQTAYAYKNQIYLNDVVEYLNGQNVLRELFDKGKQQWAEGKYAEGLKNMAIGMMQITGRVLSALDQGAISMLENQNITRYAMAALENAKDKVPKNKIREFANMTLDLKRRVITENIAAGMDKNRAVVLADLAVKSEIRAALSEFGVSYKDVLDSAVNDALQSVGRNKVITIEGVKKVQQDISDSGFLSYPPIKFLEWIASSAGQGGPAMQIFSKMVYGFALIPARTFSTAAWFSPYGFLRLAIDKYNKNKGQESPYAMSLQTEAQFKQRLTDSIAGSIVMLALFAMRSGSSDDEDDKLFKIVITGNGPNATTDKQYYDTWIKNHKPYSIELHFGDSKATINIGRGGEALFFPIMLAGALDDWEIKKKQNLTKKEPSDLNIATELLGSAFFALAQRGPYAAFTEPLFDASKQGRVTENLVGQLGYFGKTFIPVLGTSITRNISDFINDPVDRSSIEGALYANTPIVGPWIGTKALNALGQPIRADDFSDKLFKLGVPVVFSFPKNTPENALNELILKQGSGPTIPTRANAQKRFGDVLTDKEFETYVREYGRVMSDKMFKNRTRLANLKPADYDDELEKYARGYSIDGIKIKGASDSAVLAVKRMRQ